MTALLGLQLVLSLGQCTVLTTVLSPRNSAECFACALVLLQVLQRVANISGCLPLS